MRVEARPSAQSSKVPGNTEAERMSNALRKVLTVSKEDILKKEAQLKRQRPKERTKKPT